MTYHLKHWEYFIEMSCFISGQMTEVLSNSLKLLKIGISGTAFSRITDATKCVRTREGLETIMLLILQDYIGDEMKNNQLIFDKFLENIDKQMEELKVYWADSHIVT